VSALIAGALPLLLVAATGTALALLVARSLRDEHVVEGLRAEIRMLGETQRAVVETRAQITARRLRS
jgi:hypothetical protein